MRNKYILALCTALLFTFISGCGKDNTNNITPDEKPNTTSATMISPNEKILQNDNTSLDDNSIINSISGAKGEYESFQIILNNKSKKVDSVKIETSPLKCSNETIDKENISIYWQKYINVSVPTSIYSPGFYPDAILPLDKAISYNENYIEKDNNQGIWVEVHIPENAKAGKYESIIKITADDQIISVPYFVNVYDFSLPKEVHANTSYGLWYYQLVNDPSFDSAENGLHPALTDELKENYYNDFIKYRISPMVLPGDTGTPETFSSSALKYASTPKVANFQIPTTYVNTTTEFIPSLHQTVNKKNIISYIQALVEKSTNENNLVKKAYFYVGSLIDEPTPDKFELVKEIDAIIKEAKNEVYNLNIFDGKEQVRLSVLDIPHLVTGKLVPQLEGYVDTFCSTIEFHSSAMYRYEMSKAQENNTGAWWYTAVKPTAPMPSYHIDGNMIEHRILGWQSMEKGIEGNLYWSSTVFYKYNYSQGVYESRDVWNDPYAFPGAAGDGFLVYPGERYGIDSFVPTIRLQAIRDGYEDYEYLYILKNIINEVNKNYNLNIDFNEYISYISSQLYTGLIPNQDIVLFENIRNSLASIIETYNNTGLFPLVNLDFFNNEVKIEFVGKNGIEIKDEENKVITSTNNTSSFTYKLSNNNTKSFSINNTLLNLIIPTNVVKCFDMEKENAINSITSSIPKGTNTKDCSFSMENISQIQGNALKTTVTPNKDARPDHTIYIRFKDINITDFSKVDMINFDVYNPQETPILIKIKLRNSSKAKTLHDFVCKPNQTTRIELKMKDIKNFDINSIFAIDITIDATNLNYIPQTLYFSNIYTILK